MKIIIEEPEGQEEDSIIIRCRELSDDMMKMIYGLKNRNQRIPAAGNGNITMVAPEEVYYFEPFPDQASDTCIFRPLRGGAAKRRETDYFQTVRGKTERKARSIGGESYGTVKRRSGTVCQYYNRNCVFGSGILQYFLE